MPQNDHALAAELERESVKLRGMWQQYDAAQLRDYLVAGVEDPRLNVQSILTRHLLIRAVCGRRFTQLMEEELRFAAAMNWLMPLAEEWTTAEARQALLYGLQQGADDAEGMIIPPFVARLYARLPTRANRRVVPNYLTAALRASSAQPARPHAKLRKRPPRKSAGPYRAANAAVETFQVLWARVLGTLKPVRRRPKVLEAACGSANDYRFFATYRMARLIDYTGFDLCKKNVENARALFPRVRFRVGNVLALEAADRSYDYLVAQDLFEHLSPHGLEAALGEVCRVTRRGLCLGFFHMAEVAEHLVQPVADYYCSTLSLGLIKEFLARQGFGVQAIHIGTLLRAVAGCDQTHNPHAYTLIAERGTGAV